MAYLDPIDSFSVFNKNNVLHLARFYPSEFCEVVLYKFKNHLKSFILDVCLDKSFLEVLEIDGLAQKMVATRKHIILPLIYLLVNLYLI